MLVKRDDKLIYSRQRSALLSGPERKRERERERDREGTKNKRGRGGWQRGERERGREDGELT